MPENEILMAIRKSIFNNNQEFKQIIENKNFKKYFSNIYGEKLKGVPKGFPNDFEDIELLKHKHYAVTHPVENHFWTDNNLIDKAINIFNEQYAFNQFLNRSIQEL